MTILKGAENVELTQLNIEELQDKFNSINFEDIWQQVANAWSNVEDISTFFQALGTSFQGLWDSIINIGKMIYYSLEFVLVFITWITINFIEITKFIIGYIFQQ